MERKVEDKKQKKNVRKGVTFWEIAIRLRLSACLTFFYF